MSSSNEWTQRGEGEFRRPLYGTELPLAVASTLDGCCGVVTAVTVRGLSTEQVKTAWKQLPLHLPLVRLQISRKPGETVDLFEWVYQVPSKPSEEIDSWAESTFISMTANTQDEVRVSATYDRLSIAPVDRTSIKPVAKLFVGSNTVRSQQDVKGDTSEEIHLTLLSHHSITDARCQWMIIDLLINLATNLTPHKSVEDVKWGRSDVARLPRAFQYASGHRKDGDAPPTDPFAILGDMEKKRQAAGAPCVFPHISHKAFEADWHNPNGPTITKVVKLSTVDYALMHKVAKSHDTTATSWIAALLMLLQIKHNDNKDAQSVQCTGFPIDCRWLLPASHGPYYGAAMELATLYQQDLPKLKTILQHIEQSADGRIPTEFWQLADGLKRQVDDAKTNTTSIAMADPVSAMFAGVLAANPSMWDLPMTYYTSMGKASDHVKPRYTSTDGQMVTVHDFITHALVHNFSMVCFGLLEWDGELRIVTQFARSVYMDDFANIILGDLRSLLSALVQKAQAELA